MDRIKVAAVAPRSFRGDNEYRNAAQAVAHVKEAATNGAQLVCFPEGYPGPCNGPMDSGGRLASTPLETLRDAAREHGVYVACGRLEETGVIPNTYYLCHKIISPQGQLVAQYRRCQPAPPAANAHLYNGRHHVLPGSEMTAADTEMGKLGMIICSEIRVPELARVQMLMGTEILIVPFGGTHGRPQASRKDAQGIPVIETSRLISRSVALTRAVENTMYVVASTNIWEKEAQWGACIASPEGILAETEGAGIAYATLDLERLRRVRQSSWRARDFTDPELTGADVLIDPGRLRDRRPELYARLVEPQPDAFNYFYYQNGLETWRETFDPGRIEAPVRQTSPLATPGGRRRQRRGRATRAG